MVTPAQAKAKYEEKFSGELIQAELEVDAALIQGASSDLVEVYLAGYSPEVAKLIAERYSNAGWVVSHNSDFTNNSKTKSIGTGWNFRFRRANTYVKMA